MNAFHYTLFALATLLFLAHGAYNYLSGKKFFRDLIHYFQTTRKSLTYWDDYCRKNPNTSDIIISFSTIPSRMDKIIPTVKSLLSQKTAPKKIHLYVPKFSFREQVAYVIPDQITRLKCLEIKRVEKDWGPSTKFIPALQSLPPHQKILVVDDDNMYPPSMLGAFHQAAQTHTDRILAASGWRVPKDLVDRPTTLWLSLTKRPPVPIPTTRVKQDYPVDIVRGYSGFLVQPRFFDIEQLTRYPKTPEALKFVDDVWISAYAQAPKYVFPSRRYCYTPFWTKRFLNTNSLAAINNHGKRRDEDRNNSIALRYFKDKWKPD